MKSLAFAAFVLCSLPGAAQAATICGKTMPVPPHVREQGAATVTPSLTLSAPCAEALQDRQVYIAFRVDNMAVIPLYTEINGDTVTTLTPKIGHLHVTVDDAGYSWIHASNDPIYFGPVTPGTHTVRVDLVDAAHETLQTQTVRFIAK
ncbi:MAG: DUF6130 family protein [Novosphingobium sp.]